MASDNDTVEKEIRISEEHIHKAGWISIGIVVIFIIIGIIVSPQDELGKPILLLPEVKSIEDYRHSARYWISELSSIDSEIDQLLRSVDMGDVFTQSRAAQSILQSSVNLAQQVDQIDVPTVGIGLHQQILTTALSYVEAARSTVKWISVPESENKEAALNQLDEARILRKELEINQWINSQ
jgi:hypothetical protein